MLLLKPISHLKTSSVKHDFSCHFLLFLEKLDARRFGTSHPFVQWTSDNYPSPLGMKSTPIMQLSALTIEYLRTGHNIVVSTMPGCVAHKDLQNWSDFCFYEQRVQGEFRNEWMLIIGTGLLAVWMWSVTLLQSREAGFSKPHYISLVIAEIDHLRWKHRRICCC